MRGLVLALRQHTGRRHRGRDQRLEEIDLVVVVRAFEHRRDALKPHAGIDRLLGQRDAIARSQLLELHEHEVPDFDEAIAVGIGRSGRPAGDLLAMVEKDLGRGTARPRVAHLPEVVVGRDADDLVGAEPRDLFPDAIGFLVVVIDGDREAVLVDPEFLDQEPPSELDRALLEVVAEGEVAEHLEERVVARGIAHVVEVVVLAAGAHAFLGRRRRLVGARLLAGEHVLELHHAGVGEHERRIVARHERGGRHDLVAFLLEILKKRSADLVDRRHLRAFGLFARRAVLRPRTWPRAAPCRNNSRNIGRQRLSVRDRGASCQAPARPAPTLPLCNRARGFRRTPPDESARLRWRPEPRTAPRGAPARSETAARTASAPAAATPQPSGRPAPRRRTS